jgi:uncharacterized OB-fold protein
MSIAGANVSRPRPVLTPFNAFFWEGAREGRLLIQRCAECSLFQHPPAAACTHCGSDDVGPAQVSGLGEIHSFTVVHHVFHPAFKDQVPYIVARVAIEEQDDVFLFTNLRDCPAEAAYSGMPVKVVFETVGEDVLPQFVPVGPPAKLEEAGR